MATIAPDKIQKSPMISMPEKFKPTPKIGLYLFESGYSILIFGLWIKLGLKARLPEDMAESWSISFVKNENALVANWGTKNKVIYMPWDLMRIKCDVLTRDATFAPMVLEPHPHFSKMMNANEYKDERQCLRPHSTTSPPKGLFRIRKPSFT
jgi:hypothetical protein